MPAEPSIGSGGRRTVLLAWELGSGLGHARRLLAVARGLQRRGWSPVVAAREVWAGAPEYRRDAVPIVQAPRHPGLSDKEGARFRACSFADMLAACGYRRTDELLPVVLAWDHLIDLLRPAVVVADYSPILALAAHGRLPVVAIGDGFVLPPPHLPQMPMLRRDGTKLAEEPELLANAAAVQSQRGRAAPPALPALIGGQAHVVCTYPETDLYGSLRRQPASGPIDAAPPPLDAARFPAIFAYLAADFPGTFKLLQVLVDARIPVEAFVRDAGEKTRATLRASGVRVHDAPPPLAEAAARASIIVHHGGIGTSETCLALGRPQVLLPRHFEQWLNAATLVRLGVAMAVRQSFSLAEGSSLIAEATASERLAARAAEAAAALAGRSSDSVERILDGCEALAGAPRSG